MINSTASEIGTGPFKSINHSVCSVNDLEKKNVQPFSMVRNKISLTFHSALDHKDLTSDMP